MTKEKFSKLVRTYLRENGFVAADGGAGYAGDDVTFEEIGLTSLDANELLIFLEDQTGIRLSTSMTLSMWFGWDKMQNECLGELLRKTYEVFVKEGLV